MDKQVQGARQSMNAFGGVLELASLMYAAWVNSTKPTVELKVSSREPAMLAFGLDPGPRQARAHAAEPGLIRRLAIAGWTDLNNAARKLDQAVGWSSNYGVVKAATLCNIAPNSSLAELRAAVEDMNLVFTSSRILGRKQAIDDLPQSVLNDPRLVEAEESVLLDHCIFVIDKDLPRPQQLHLMAVLEGVAEAKNSEVGYFSAQMKEIVDGDYNKHLTEVESGPCATGALGQPKTLRYDGCIPYYMVKDLVTAPVYLDGGEETLNGTLPVLFADAEQIKWLEGQYTGVVNPNNPKTVVTIRRPGVTINPLRQCRVRRPETTPTPLPDYAIGLLTALGVVLVAGAGAAGGGYFVSCRQKRKAEEDVATNVPMERTGNDADNTGEPRKT